MDALLDLLDPKWWLTMFGAFATIGVLAIVFAETGLLFGFFLPGDSLLVAAGIFAVPAAAAGLGISPLSLPVLLIAAPLCAIAGAQLGHFLGAKFGRKLFDKPDSRLFKQEHVEKAEYYFEKFGPAKAVVLARFMPIVRTFLNPVAGVLGMDARRFFVWNVVGGVLWIESMLLFGYFVGSAVENIDRYILPGVFVIVLLSILPIVREVIKNKKSGGAPLDGKHHRPEGVPAAAAATAAAPAAVDPFDAYINQMTAAGEGGFGAPRTAQPYAGGAQYGGQPGGQYGGQPGGQYGGQYGGQSDGQYGGQPGGQHNGQYGGQPGGQYGGQYGGTHPTAGRPADPYGARPAEPYAGGGHSGGPYAGDPYGNPAQPGGASPWDGNPGASYPGGGHPGGSYPGAAQPGAAQTGAAQSGSGYPGDPYSGPTQYGEPYPGSGQPGAAPPPGAEQEQPATAADWQAWQSWQGPDRNR